MTLKRTFSVPLLMFYGLGTIIGAGVYALIGAVAQQANEFTPIAFIVAAIIAGFTAASYAELSARFPSSAGSAMYVNQAFKMKWLTSAMGWLMVLTGIVSGATLTLGFVNYFHLFLPIHTALIIPVIVLVLGFISIWGITESAITITIMTLLELFGLLMVIVYGGESFTKPLQDIHRHIPSFSLTNWSGVLTGAFIAFYAFVGFEDIVTVAEETKNPQKTIPRALLGAFLIATLLYILVSYVLITSLPFQELTTSDLPLTVVIKHQGHSPALFTCIALAAIANGILVQIIMSSRVLFGMAKLKTAPKIFAHIYQKTHIPLIATATSIIAIILLALLLPIETLAKSTSGIMLVVFALINFSLVKIKTHSKKKVTHFCLPIIFPITGGLLAIIFLVTQLIFLAMDF